MFAYFEPKTINHPRESNITGYKPEIYDFINVKFGLDNLLFRFDNGAVEIGRYFHHLDYFMHPGVHACLMDGESSPPPSDASGFFIHSQHGWSTYTCTLDDRLKIFAYSIGSVSPTHIVPGAVKTNINMVALSPAGFWNIAFEGHGEQLHFSNCHFKNFGPMDTPTICTYSELANMLPKYDRPPISLYLKYHDNLVISRLIKRYYELRNRASDHSNTRT